MSSPQKENGFVPICTEVMEALIRYRIPGEQRQCLDFIIRKTYGYNKKEDRISNSQFVESTGMNKANVCRALRELSKKQLVVKNDNTTPTTYRFNKHYGEWEPLSKKTTVVNIATVVIKKDNISLSKVTDTIDKIDNITKDKKNTCLPEANTGCPFQKIVDLYHSSLPDLPRVKVLTEARKGYIKARWNENGRDFGWWEEYFSQVKESAFLCGKCESFNGRKPFIADLEWLVKPSNMVKVIEGKYSDGKGKSGGVADDRMQRFIAKHNAGRVCDGDKQDGERIQGQATGSDS